MNTQVYKILVNKVWLIIAILLSCSKTFAYDFEVNRLCYNILSNNTVELTWRGINSPYTGDIVIPDNISYNGIVYKVVRIGDDAFEEVLSVSESGQVKQFNYNSELTSVKFPSTLISIGQHAFDGCSGITSIIFPSSLTSIEHSAFSGCSGLTSITIPAALTSISGSVFQNCSNLTYIEVESENKRYDSRNSCNAIIETSTNRLIIGCKNTVIPNSVTSIGGFSHCSGLTSITIPSSVTKIEDYAFFQCFDLASITIPNSVTSIGNSAFYNCKALTSIAIPNSVTDIGHDAFSLCSALTSITIPNSVTDIGNSAFSYCRNLGLFISYIENPFVIDYSVFYNISSSAILKVPKGTKSKYEALYCWVNNFKEVEEFGNTSTYTLSITASGNGSASYGSTTIRSKTSSYTVNAGSSATITFSPDNGYRIKNVKVNNTTVSVSNNQYTISSINANTTVSVEFEAIPATTYTLSITASGNGSASYSGTTIRSKTSSFTLNAGSSATITFSPDNGYRIKSVMVNNSTVTVSDNQYTISSINANTMVSVEFEAIPVTYTLSITATGNGSASYDGTTIRSKTSSFTVNEGTTVKISITPDNGYRIKSVKENNTVVTSYVSNGIYTINSLSRNTTVEVEFEEILQAFSADDVNYTVVSVDKRTIRLAKGDYGITLEVPAKVNYQNAEWTVTGIDNGALANNPDLAAIVWNPDVAFTEQVSNPNLLLYVNQTQYAPSSIKNVVVNGNATSITLTDAASGNNFHCPQAFTAQKISYTHNYSMKTGIGEARGWETIALPFDVQKVTHESKGEIVSFANWRSGDAKKPFWLMQLSGSGWTMATSIKANTPYIISMPKNDEYKAGFWLDGRVTFSAENVYVAKTENLSIANYSDRTFVPIFTSLEKSNDVFALNVVNDIERNSGGATEGSSFERNLRVVHPFEAYMTSTSSARSIGIDEGMATGIDDLMFTVDGLQFTDDYSEEYYDLQGRRVKQPGKGVYIYKGKKVIR